MRTKARSSITSSQPKGSTEKKNRLENTLSFLKSLSCDFLWKYFKAVYKDRVPLKSIPAVQSCLIQISFTVSYHIFRSKITHRHIEKDCLFFLQDGLLFARSFSPYDLILRVAFSTGFYLDNSRVSSFISLLYIGLLISIYLNILYSYMHSFYVK